MLAEAHPIVRMLIRLVALPYYYFYGINWDKCNSSKIQVVFDLLFIFFKLKYYPDNYSKCQLWNKPRADWIYYYGSMYDPWQRWRLRKEVFPYRYKYLYDDKTVSYLLCKSFGHSLPKWYGRVTPTNFKEEISSIINKNKIDTLIVKPIVGNGGYGVLLVKLSNKSIFVKEGDRLVPLEQYNLKEQCLVQEYIEQHKSLNEISKSINTIRIVTMLTKSGETIILGARMRFGVNDAFLDNTCQGGIAVKINMSDGTLEEYAYDNKSRSYTEHPTSHYVFKGFKIPYWREVELLAKNVQKTIQYNKIIGQDIAITPDGPVIIELNSEYDNVMFEQACGPILKNNQVLQEFKQYDLLINKYQKALLEKSD